MAWVAGADVSTGDLITAAQWNNYMGAAGSLEYLKTEADKIDDLAAADQTGSRAIDGTVYTNSTKIRVVTVTTKHTINAADGDVKGVSYVEAHSDNNADPTTKVGAGGIDGVDLDGLDITDNWVITYSTVTFMVKPSEKYKVTATDSGDGSSALQAWIEWDVH